MALATNSSLFALEVPAKLSLGYLPSGSVKNTTLELKNLTPVVVAIDRIETSCECLQIEPILLLIDPYAKSRIKLIFSTIEEPKFRGRLQVEIIARGSNNHILFKTVVDLEVGP